MSGLPLCLPAQVKWPASRAILQPVDQAVVLGSTQALTSVDQGACATAGVDIVRRRSGGGAVLVDAPSLLWVDLVVPAGDPLWCADVGRAAWWVGEAWSEALDRAGMDGTRGLEGPDGPQPLVVARLLRRAWRRRGCKRCRAKGGGHLSAPDAPWGLVPVRLRPGLGATRAPWTARP